MQAVGIEVKSSQMISIYVPPVKAGRGVKASTLLSEKDKVQVGRHDFALRLADEMPFFAKMDTVVDQDCVPIRKTEAGEHQGLIITRAAIHGG